MYQYYKKIENVFNNNNSQAVAVSTKLIDYRMYSQCVNGNVEKRIRGMTGFFESNDCVAMKEVINLYNDLLSSSSETERNYAKTDIDRCYIVTWLAKCFEKGDIIDDKVNFDDSEFNNTINVANLVDYIKRTEKLIRPYYTEKQKEED